MVPSLPTIPNPWISGRFPQRLYHPGRKANPANTVCSARVFTLTRNLRGLYVFLLDKFFQAPDPAILFKSSPFLRPDLNPDPDARRKMAVADFHSEGGDVQSNVWELFWATTGGCRLTILLFAVGPP
jgi:hypothetical protein